MEAATAVEAVMVEGARAATAEGATEAVAVVAEGPTEEVAVMAADVEAEVALVARPPAGWASRRAVAAKAVVMAMEVVARVAGVARVAVDRAAMAVAMAAAMAAAQCPRKSPAGIGCRGLHKCALPTCRCPSLCAHSPDRRLRSPAGWWPMHCNRPGAAPLRSQPRAPTCRCPQTTCR